tara:strand:+ start:90 stop:278 length:189 start_codon:yes stop_codon:yes gene_type:complete
MQSDKKASELSNHLFDMSKSFANMSRSGQLYGRLDMILDMKIWIASQEKEVRKQIEESESNV